MRNILRAKVPAALSTGSLLVAALSLAGFAATQAPQFRADVARVRVDVLVTDEDGSFVDDLTSADFSVREDGTPQPVLSVELIDTRRGRPGADAAAIPPDSASRGERAPPVRGETRATPDARAVDDPPAAAPGKLVVLIDLVGLDYRTKARITGHLDNWLEDQERLSTAWALYLLDAERRIYEFAPLGSEPAPLRAALDWLRDFRWPRGGPGRVMLNDDLVRQRQLADLGTAGPAIAAPPFAQHLAAGDGRTALLWVTTRVTSTFFGREVLRAANSAGVSIYVLNPFLRPLGRSLPADARATWSPRTLSDTVFFDRILPLINEAADDRRAMSRDAAASLREVAEATGGTYFDQWERLGPVLSAVEEETSRYYVITYAAPPPFADGRYHEIEVMVARPGTTVKARRGYIDYDPAQRRDRLVNAFRTLPSVGGPLTIAADAYFGWNRDGEPQVTVATGVDASQLGVIEDEETGAPAVRFAVRATALDQEGQIAGEMVDLAEGAPPLTARAVARPMIHMAVWELDPDQHGDLAIELVVVDQASNRSGNATVAVDVPEPEDADWQLGRPILVDAVGAEVRLQGEVPFRSPTDLFLQVRGGVAPVLRGGISPRDAAAADASAAAPFAPTPLRRAGRLHEGSVRLPSDLPPGTYRLTFRIVDEPAGRETGGEMMLRVVAGG